MLEEVKSHRVSVVRDYPDAYLEAYDSMPPLECEELQGWRNESQGYPRYVWKSQGSTIVNLLFLGHPQQGTGFEGGWHATHRCHNPRCIKAEHVYFAPMLVNHGTSACVGGTFCAHAVSCLFPGSYSQGWC